LQEGQGSHGSFGRDNTFNNMTAPGPAFKHGFVDELPASNADIAMTAAQLLALTLAAKGSLQGRVLTEALEGGGVRASPEHTVASTPDTQGKVTLLQFQQLDGHRYFDAACRVEGAAQPRRCD